MNTSQTSTLIHPQTAPYNGVTALTYTEAMDVDADGQRLADQDPDKDIMDTALDGAQAVPDKGKAPEVPADRDAPVVMTEITASTEPESVLERPREGGEDGARESPRLMRKTPH